MQVLPRTLKTVGLLEAPKLFLDLRGSGGTTPCYLLLVRARFVNIVQGDPGSVRLSTCARLYCTLHGRYLGEAYSPVSIDKKQLLNMSRTRNGAANTGSSCEAIEVRAIIAAAMERHGPGMTSPRYRMLQFLCSLIISREGKPSLEAETIETKERSNSV